MVRKHGWQLPAHTLQGVTITVFCLLVVAFYAFFAPFLGGHIWEYALVAMYLHGLSAKDLPRKFDELTMGAHSSPSSASISSIPAHNSCRKGSTGGSGGTGTVVLRWKSQIDKHHVVLEESSAHCLCMKIVAKRMGQLSRMARVKMLCSAHYASLRDYFIFSVRKFGKHCRSCEKCVDGFDRHCRWLNNCVGRKNYVSFISLMATGCPLGMFRSKLNKSS